MGTPVVANLVKSGAVLWVAPVGEANPDETSVAWGASWGGNWERVGFTKAPLTVAYEWEETEGEVEEELGSVKRWRNAESMAWETVLAELTAEYLQLAASNQDTVSETPAGGSQKGYEETGIGGEPLLTEKKWGIEGLFVNADGDEEPIRIFMHKGTAYLNGELQFSLKEDDYVGIPILIRALTDTTQSRGQKLAIFQRVTAEATS